MRFERGADHSKNIVIHHADVSGNYRLEIVGMGSDTMDLKIQAPDFGGNLVNKNTYLAVPITPSTKSQLDISTTGENALDIDSNGDGVYEEQRPPDVSQPTTVDFTPPARMTDLAVTGVSSGTAVLSWTSTGDDGNQGNAAKFELRYATSPITEENWDYAMPAGQVPDPQAPGTLQSATVHGLNAGTSYYFAIRARDDAWQQSPLSNVVAATTQIPSLAWARQRIYWAGWEDYQNRQLSIDYKLSNIGTGLAVGSAIAASICNPDTVYVTTPLPLTVGDLYPGSYNAVALKYFVPATVGSFTTTTYANCADDAGRLYWYPGPLP